MLGFLFQVILLVIIVSITFTYRDRIRNLLLASIITSCLLCIANITLDVYKIYFVNQEFIKLKDMNVFIFGVISNVLSIAFICLVLFTIIIIAADLINSKEKNVLKKNIRKFNVIYGLMIVVCIFGIAFFESEITFSKVSTNTEVEKISDIEIVNNDNIVEINKVKKLLENIEKEFSDDDIFKWCEEVKTSEFIQIKLLDENVEVYTFYDSRNIIHKYVDPIANIRVRESYDDILYSTGPDLGVYDIVELVYYEIEERRITRKTAIIIYGITNRDYNIENNREFFEQAVYVYILEDNVEINLFGINVPNDNRDYYYIYDFLGNWTFNYGIQTAHKLLYLIQGLS